jgi:hypothetical protein
MLARLSALLRAHGLDVELREDHIFVPSFGQRWEAEVVRELEHAIQLDVRIELWRGRWLVESVTGLGAGDAARNDALEAFAIGPLHVILDAFRGNAHETWTIGGRAVEAYVGPCNVRGKAIDPTAWCAGFRGYVETGLPEGVHWLRVFYAHSDGKRVALEILRDNERWSEAVTALDGAPWPGGNGYVSVRMFAILRSGIDVTEVAARMLELDDAEIEKRFGRWVLAIVPLAFGRVLLDKLGVAYSATAIVDDREVALEADAMYRSALAHARAVHDRDGDMFRTLALRSAEIDAVNQALHRGSQPADLLLSPPVIA